MPTISDYLQAVSGAFLVPQAAKWVRLVNNSTSTAYVSTGATDATGLFTVNNVPAGLYTVYQGPTSGGAWTATGDAAYQVDAVNIGWVNVKDYGALGDGSTDDTTAIQAAITAVFAVGGLLYLPSGTYIVTGLTLPTVVEASGVPTQKQVTIMGAGTGTILKLKNSANAHVLATASFATLIAGTTAMGNWRLRIRDLVIDGNKANNSSGVGLALYGWANNVQHVILQNCASHGLHTQWGVDRSGGDVDTQMEGIFQDLLLINNGGHGWLMKGPHDSMVSGVVAKGNSQWGVYVDTIADGFHAWSLQIWNNGLGGFYHNVAVTIHDLGVSCDNSHPSINTGPTSAPSSISGIISAGGPALKVESQYHFYRGSLANCAVGLEIAGGYACQYDLQMSAVTQQFKFTTDNGDQIIRGVGALPQYTVTAASWASNTSTYTTSVPHNMGPNTRINIVGVTPSGYNNVYDVQTAPSATTFTVTEGANPGAYVSGGTVYGSTYTGTLHTSDIVQWHFVGGTDVFLHQLPQSTSARLSAGALALSGDFRRSKQSPAFTAAPTPDPTLGEIYEMAALTGAVNVGNPVNAARGQRLRFYWKQDGTGGRAVTYTGSNFRSVGIAAQTTTLNTYTIDEAECLDGTIWRVMRLVTGQTV